MTGWRLLLAQLSGHRCRAVHPAEGIRCVKLAGHDRERHGWAHGAPIGFGYRWWK